MDAGYTSVMLISQETSNTCTTSEVDPALVHEEAQRSVDLTNPVDLEAKLQTSSPKPSVPKRIGYMHRCCVTQATKCLTASEGALERGSSKEDNLNRHLHGNPVAA
jgi:hypothetical protein